MKVGDFIKVKKGITDPDTNMDIGGFVGQIKKYLASNLLNIAWDSISLQNLSDDFIRGAINDGCEYLTYNIGPEDVELCKARDTPSDMVKAIRVLGEKWDKLEIFGDLEELIEEIEEEGWSNYLEEQITFPFTASHEGEYGMYGYRDNVKVLKIHEEDYEHGLIMKCKIDHSTMYFPLAELIADDDSSDGTKAAVSLYREYFWDWQN